MACKLTVPVKFPKDHKVSKAAKATADKDFLGCVRGCGNFYDPLGNCTYNSDGKRPREPIECSRAEKKEVIAPAAPSPVKTAKEKAAEEKSQKEKDDAEDMKAAKTLGLDLKSYRKFPDYLGKDIVRYAPYYAAIRMKAAAVIQFENMIAAKAGVSAAHLVKMDHDSLAQAAKKTLKPAQSTLDLAGLLSLVAVVSAHNSGPVARAGKLMVDKADLQRDATGSIPAEQAVNDLLVNKLCVRGTEWFLAFVAKRVESSSKDIHQYYRKAADGKAAKSSALASQPWPSRTAMVLFACGAQARKRDSATTSHPPLEEIMETALADIPFGDEPTPYDLTPLFTILGLLASVEDALGDMPNPEEKHLLESLDAMETWLTSRFNSYLATVVQGKSNLANEVAFLAQNKANTGAPSSQVDAPAPPPAAGGAGKPGRGRGSEQQQQGRGAPRGGRGGGRGGSGHPLADASTSDDVVHTPSAIAKGELAAASNAPPGDHKPQMKPGPTHPAGCPPSPPGDKVTGLHVKCANPACTSKPPPRPARTPYCVKCAPGLYPVK